MCSPPPAWDDRGVLCEVARESLSARLDGEREPVPSRTVDAHLASCADCRAWWSAASALSAIDDRPTPRVGSVESVLRAAHAVQPPAVGTADRTRRLVAGALVVTGIALVAIALAQAAGAHFGLLTSHRMADGGGAT